jgi:hypothetical protein
MNISTKYLDDSILDDEMLLDSITQTNNHLKKFFEIPIVHQDYFDNLIGIMCNFFYKIGKLEGENK